VAFSDDEAIGMAILHWSACSSHAVPGAEIFMRAGMSDKWWLFEDALAQHNYPTKADAARAYLKHVLPVEVT
jgi:hypothetical protein